MFAMRMIMIMMMIINYIDILVNFGYGGGLVHLYKILTIFFFYYFRNNKKKIYFVFVFGKKKKKEIKKS